MTLKIRRHGLTYNFVGDTETGVTFRWGSSLRNNPVFAPWPELADISISNHCTKGCDFCYRDSKINKSFMKLDDYIFILRELNHSRWGNVFQIAIGGGEPLEHPQWKEIVEATRSYSVIPNITTNGIRLDHDAASFLKGRIGAIAISTSLLEDLDLDKVNLLAANSIKTNIHYVLSQKNLQQAIKILLGEYDKLFSGINSIIFLTHKPAGRAGSEDCLILNNELKQFIKLVDKCSKIRIGFDACFIPILLHFTQIIPDYVDSCESGFFSVFIDEQLNVKPCSFANDDNFNYNLKHFGFKEIWEAKYQIYRNKIVNKCKNNCNNRDYCKGPCPYYKELNYCYST